MFNSVRKFVVRMIVPIYHTCIIPDEVADLLQVSWKDNTLTVKNEDRSCNFWEALERQCDSSYRASHGLDRSNSRVVLEVVETEYMPQQFKLDYCGICRNSPL